MKTNILCFPRSASTIGVSSSSTNVPPSFLFFRVLLSQQGGCHQHFQHDNYESQTRLLASSWKPAFISALGRNQLLRRSVNRKLQHMNNQMINFQAILWPTDPMRRRRGEWTFQKLANRKTKKSLFQKYSPSFAISPNQHLCHKVCLGKCMYCWAYPKPQKTEALTRNWRNEIILAQHIPYQHSNPTLTRNTSTYSRNVTTCGKYLATFTFHGIDLFRVWRRMEGWRRRC